MKENILLTAAKAANENVNRKDFKDTHQLKEEDVKAAIDEALINFSLRQEIRKLLFPEGIVIGEVFFEKLQEFYVLLGFHSIVNELVSEISLDIFKELDEKNVEKLLNFLVNTKGRYFWIYLRSFVFLFKKYNLDHAFISKWFVEICEKMGNDLASGDFYTAIGNYAYSFPDEALKILNIYTKDKMDSITLHISSIILGNIRAKMISEGKNYSVFIELEKNYYKSEIVDKRIIYYGSYLHTYYKVEPSEETLVKLLNEAVKDEDKLKEQAFFIINRYVNSKREDNNIVDFGLSWVEKNIRSDSSDMCKYNVIDLLRWIAYEDRKQKDVTIFHKINRILEKTLPIPIDNGGTWSNLQDLLRDTLEVDSSEFEKMILTVLHNSSKEFLHYLKDGQFDLLTQNLEGINLRDFILRLVTSNDKTERELGFLFMNIMQVNYVDGISNFEIKDENSLLISLLEFRRKLILGREISDYLSSIEPFFKNVSEKLNKELVREMIFQAINYPGECLDKWKNSNNKSEILEVVIKSAEDYFNKIKETATLPVNSYCMPEIIEAEKELRRRFSKNVSEGAQEKSIFMKFVKKTRVLYGNTWSLSYDNKVDDPSKFGEISQSFEFPRVEYIDPEGMALRRITARIELKNLTNEFSD